MKSLIAFALSGFCRVAMADETAASPQPVVEPYSYSQHLDIARVISSTPIPDVCAVVPMQMTYDDHNGQRHTMSYLIMGNGCTN